MVRTRYNSDSSTETNISVLDSSLCLVFSQKDRALRANNVVRRRNVIYWGVKYLHRSPSNPNEKKCSLRSLRVSLYFSSNFKN